jgi:hypothetical protein
VTGHKPWSSVKKKASVETVVERQFSLPTFGPGEWEVLMTRTKESPYVLRVIRDSTGTTSTSCIFSPSESNLLLYGMLGLLKEHDSESYQANIGKHDSVCVVREDGGWRGHFRTRKAKARQKNGRDGGGKAIEDGARVFYAPYDY